MIHREIIGPEYGKAMNDMLALASEGFCPNSCSRLHVDELHGRMQAWCGKCLLAWYIEDGRLWVCACTPTSHTCGRRE